MVLPPETMIRGLEEGRRRGQNKGEPTKIYINNDKTLYNMLLVIMTMIMILIITSILTVG